MDYKINEQGIVETRSYFNQTQFKHVRTQFQPLKIQLNLNQQQSSSNYTHL